MASETHDTVHQSEWRSRLLADVNAQADNGAKRSGEISDTVRSAVGALLDAATFDSADVTIEQTKNRLVVTLTHDAAKARAHADAVAKRDEEDAARNERIAARGQ